MASGEQEAARDTLHAAPVLPTRHRFHSQSIFVNAAINVFCSTRRGTHRQHAHNVDVSEVSAVHMQAQLLHQRVFVHFQLKNTMSQPACLI